MPKSDLEKYRQKRDFSKTPEPPPGDADAQARNLVFVVQQHAARAMHWDFRLEVDGVLKSWPLPKGPTVDAKVKRGAVMTEDHPYDYRTFEGVIPKGEYGGGQVIVWDEGIYTPDEDGETSWDDKEEGSRRMMEGIARGKLSFTLQGRKLRGSFTLVKTSYGPNTWLFMKHKDEFASERDILQEDRSVRSGLTIKDLKEGRLPNVAALAVEAQAGARVSSMLDPKSLRPMLATLVDQAFDTPGWLWEPKLDGVRVLAFLKDGKVELRSRRGIESSKQYPVLCKALESLGGTMVLDGEVCALDENGVPRFELLQGRINLTRANDVARMEAERPIVYFVFDLLYLDGYDLRGVPLKQRRALLESRLRSDGAIQIVSAIEDAGSDLKDAAKELGFEGVVGKRADSKYEAGNRSKSWLKVKVVNEQEFVVGGYTAGEGGRKSSFGALAIGYYEGERLKYAGNVGSGFDDAELGAMMQRLRDLSTDKAPFDGPAEGKPKWVRPEIVVQLKYAEWTRDGRLRAPVFLGVRTDIDPKQVGRERAEKIGTLDVTEVASSQAATSAPQTDVSDVLSQLENPKANFTLEVAGEHIPVTNLDKEFWPEHEGQPSLTKRDLMRFYVNVAPYLLPHLTGRPLTLTRYPNGVTAKPFYQKHYEQPIPSFVDTTLIWSDSNVKDGIYILCNNLPTLVWLAQIADLELHAWMSRLDPEPDAHGRPLDASTSEAIDASVLNYPDYVVFDLDPYIYAGHEKGKEEPEYNKRGWEKTVEIAFSLKDLLDQLKLSSFLKTSGKTGLHVYVPILRHYTYDDVRAATQTIGRFLVQQHPKDVTMEWDTSKRRGKVFFDANQNTRGKTLAAQYSLRPTPWAGVSTPISWPELATLDPVAWNIRTVVERLQKHGDPWADILSRKNDLQSLLS